MLAHYVEVVKPIAEIMPVGLFTPWYSPSRHLPRLLDP
jgi:hypothetical protein